MTGAHGFIFEAHGHRNILATHPTTIEVTRSEELTLRGDCVIGVGASHGLVDLPESVRYPLTSDSGRCQLVMRVGRETVSFRGRGASGLTLSHPNEIVARKSGFLSDRTLMIHIDKAAIDVPRHIVDLMKDPEQKIVFEILTWQTGSITSQGRSLRL